MSNREFCCQMACLVSHISTCFGHVIWHDTCHVFWFHGLFQKKNSRITKFSNFLLKFESQSYKSHIKLTLMFLILKRFHRFFLQYSNRVYQKLSFIYQISMENYIYFVSFFNKKIELGINKGLYENFYWIFKFYSLWFLCF